MNHGFLFWVGLVDKAGGAMTEVCRWLRDAFKPHPQCRHRVLLSRRAAISILHRCFDPAARAAPEPALSRAVFCWADDPLGESGTVVGAFR